MRLGLDRRRSSVRNSSFSEGSEHSSIDQRANAVPAMTTEIETVPMEFDAVSLGSIDSLSSIEDPLLLTGRGDKATKGELPVFSSKIKDELEVAKYMEAREMTLTQERWNALTILPSPIYCVYYISSGQWISGKYASDVIVDQDFDQSQCLTSPWFPHHALPPLPVLYIAIAICVHAPTSFLYHWFYANYLPPLARISHWSRRLDHVFIHVASALVSYGTSGSWDYFLANVMFNADCMYRQFMKKVRPRHNQVRIGISILAYTIPILRRGDVLMFGKCWIIIFMSGWLFAKYPLKGWSHSAFHVVIALLPIFLMQVAVELPVSQEQISLAVHCAATNGGV